MTVTSLVADVVQKDARLSAVLLLLLAILITVRYYRSPWRKLPPGPTGLPLLGNLHQINHGKQWVTFSKWKETYGPIFYLNAGGQPIIVLGSVKVAADLLDRRASIYSDRPRFIVASEMMAGGMFIVFTGFNDVWKRMRKACHEYFNRSFITLKCQTTQRQEAITLAQDLLMNFGKEWNDHVERASASFITSMLYGMSTHSPRDPALAKINEFMGRLTTAAMPGTHLVEFFTWMQYIPARFAGWKRKVLKAAKEDSVMFQKLLDAALERKENGGDKLNMAASLMQDRARNRLSETECSWLVAAVYGGSSHTTASVLAWWLLAILEYPQTQKRAQEEIDRVVGRDRLPTFDDMKEMPYVQAMVKEVLRWAPVAPLGAPHYLMEDDWYHGHFLPKNSIVIANIWGINRDPMIFGEDASDFNPDRHLDEKGQISPAPADTKEEGHVAYGFGRRICVGRYVANDGLFIYIATLLWAMNIERTKDEKGNLVKLDVDKVVDLGLAVRPVHFDCNITPRSSDVLAILEQAKDC